ncbi:putative ATP-dependent RNA helicase DHR1 [Puccinia graminis f. sp. tritici]|uniref:RNA helicase n=1 Tax=Puccinia graminis f. sp. tritici TaxID=56615 RepID=A0A5B0SDQ8_PUCGR|nr:putative ATP-dependent RNA helicase DHR1 [Puccinia graminis f. sp. tritici]
MGFSRPRYNQKARSHRSAPQDEQKQKTELDYSRVEAVVDHEELGSSSKPKTMSAVNQETEDRGSMSKKKRKRFDAYVQKKLKKERRNELIQELEKTQSSVKDPSAFISTAHLCSSSVARTQRELKATIAEVESRRRERARGLISSKQKLRSGYHSQSDLEDESDPTPATNPFSGAVEICNASSESNITAKKTPRHPPKPTVASQPLTVAAHKVAFGSALASGAITTHVKRPVKKKRKSHKPPTVLDDDDDSFDDSESSTHSSSTASDDQDQAQSSSSGSSSSSWPEEEEWTGCDDSLQVEEVLVDTDTPQNQPQPDLLSEPTPRVKGSIRDWANKQLQLAEENKLNSTVRHGLEVTASSSPPETRPVSDVPQSQETKSTKTPQTRCGPLGAPLDLPETPLFLHQKTSHVPLERDEEVIASRSLLPVFAEEHTVMDAIRRHPVVVICGETGSGKTTQVPQFLYEAGWGKSDGDNPGLIGVTQPRRVAAVSMARRVEKEMGLSGQGIVSHQIRYDTTTSSTTKIKFMTDGVILRELAADFLLSKYSVVIVDEAHERSINTDVLIGVLSRIVRLRLKTWMENLSNKNSGQNSAGKTSDTEMKTGICCRPLRLIIMSATLRVSDFTLNSSLFSQPPPVIEIAARQFPVAVHFMRRTPMDYVNEAFTKAAKIHSRLPPGGILIFLTGQLEITKLCRKLEQKFGKKIVEERKARKAALQSKSSTLPCAQSTPSIGERDTNDHGDTPQEPVTQMDGFSSGEAEMINLGKDKHEFAADVDEGQEWEEDPEALDTDEEDDLIVEGVELVEDSDVPMYILPLYSLLPTDQQMKVFEDPPPGTRLVVVATNVAETSLTIPNIRYVIDSGRAKERHYDLSTGIQSFEIDWISKASASQRSGRAGRTGPGHCYRLYSSAVFENYFPQFAKPEIQRMPIDGIVLQMKSMNIDTVTNFPFPTPPDRFALRKSEISLAHLGALSFPHGQSDWFMKGDPGGEGTITELGRAMAKYPLSPRFARMLVSGFQYECLAYVIAMVSILSVGDPFIHESAIDEDNPTDCLDDQAINETELLKNADCKDREIRRQKRRQFFKVQQQFASLGNGVSDLFKVLAVVGAYEFGQGNNPSKFCHENFVRPKAMEEIHKLRAQITRIVQAATIATGLKVEFSPKLMPPSETQLKVLRQLIASAFIDQVAIKASKVKSCQSSSGKSGANNPNRNLVAYRAIGIEEDVFIHPSSVLFDSNVHPEPEFIVFQELHRTEKRIWIKGITLINPSWLPVLGKSLCTFSKPIDNSTNNKIPSRATDTERKCFVIPKFGGPGLDVELGPVQMTQRKVGNLWVWV